MLWHITESDLKNNPLSENQHAFRPGHSTESAALHVINKIEIAFEQNKYAIGTFIDISGAFDRVSGDAIIQSMLERGVSDQIILWYQHYIKNRISSLTVQNTSKTKTISEGCPQGRCLSTLAWNIVFNKLLEKLKHWNVTITGFADDAALIAIGDHLGPIIKQLNMALKIANTWAKEQSLEISKEKLAQFFLPVKENLNGQKLN